MNFPNSKVCLIEEWYISEDCLICEEYNTLAKCNEDKITTLNSRIALQVAPCDMTLISLNI